MSRLVLAAYAVWSKSHSSLRRPAATNVAGFSLHSVDSFFRDDRNHDEGRQRVGPSQPENGVEQQSGQEDGR